MTPRQLADACCDECRGLTGDGPWCPRCGQENLLIPPAAAVPTAEHETHYTTWVCPTCAKEIA